MKLLSLWPWYSFCLLFLNLALEAGTLGTLLFRKSLPRLSLLRVYLAYTVIAGAVGIAAAAVSPAGSSLYWITLSVIEIGYNAVLFLLCAQIVDHLIRRDDVQRVKKVWLFGMPAAFVIAVLANDLSPARCVPAMLTFNAFAAVISGLTVIACYITPDEDWLPGYRGIITAAGFQIVSLALANLVYTIARCPWLDVFAPLMSAITAGLMLWTALKTAHAEVSETA